MRLLFVVDGRSPIALNWIEHFLTQGHQVHLVSTFSCAPDPRLASYTYIPTAFSQMKRVSAGGRRRSLGGEPTVRLRTLLRQWFGPLTLPGAARTLQEMIQQIQPELVHAMRIPYEGMLAALALAKVDSTHLLISVWGNDFTLHAPSTPLMRRYTRLALARADALHADCRRDIRLARGWGFLMDKPSIVLPGAGGVQPALFYPPAEAVSEPVVIQPRGFRAYVNNHAFFRSIPLVLARQPKARFICPAMAEQLQARHWVEELKLEKNVELLPVLSRAGMADLFRRARMVVSPSNHDGTPNTLLEAMACGCLPVAGDLDSLREWITPGENGLLVNPNDPESLAQAILSALEDDTLQLRARQQNLQLIAERAEYGAVMRQAEGFYRQLVSEA